VTPPEETMGALDELVREGKVRHVAASNVSPARLEAALEASAREGVVRYVALQPHYNLVEREYEDGLADVCRRHDLGCLPYFALAKGFLTGKYRTGADGVQSQRAQGARAYLDERGERVLAALDAAAAAHDVPVAAVSLAWLAARPAVVAPIASARTPAQLAELLAMTDVVLRDDELSALDAAGAG
jgi:aryl-alcohol dehydrogenase-like predicted oxidoreductase